jgi:predicted DNA-binding transcriptional regulator AlpA
MNINEIATKEDIKNLHERINQLFELLEKNNSSASNSDDQRYLTSKQVMQIYKVSKTHLKNLRDEGKIPYSNPFGVILYPQSEIEELVRKGIIRGGV